MIESLQDITRTIDRGTSQEIMFVADGANHVQWFYLPQVGFRDELIGHGCEECSDIHDWRRVYVKA